MRTLESIKEFREGLVNLIKSSAIQGIGDNVYSGRKESAWPEESAFAVVYTPQTSFDDRRTSPRFYLAKMEVYVDLYARATTVQDSDDEAVDDVNVFLDDASAAIVSALQPVESRVGPFNGTVKRFVLTNFANNLSEKGETDRGSQRITFSAEFAVCVTNGGASDEFITAKNTASIGPGNGNKQEFNTTVRI